MPAPAAIPNPRPAGVASMTVMDGGVTELAGGRVFVSPSKMSPPDVLANLLSGGVALAAGALSGSRPWVAALAGTGTFKGGNTKTSSVGGVGAAADWGGPATAQPVPAHRIPSAASDFFMISPLQSAYRPQVQTFRNFW